MARCPKCGVEVDEDSTECPACGTSLLRDNYWCWSCLKWIGKDEYWWTQHGMLFQRRSEIKWIILNGKATPFCPHCQTNLIHQPRTHIAKRWMKYALMILCIFVLLRIAAQLVEWLS